MIYATFAFWLIVCVFAAQGIYHLWTSNLARKWVDAFLLPATLVAQVGFLLATLITGGTVRQARLFDSQEGQSDQTTHSAPRFGIIGAVLAAGIPLAFCVAMIAIDVRYVGAEAIYPLFSASLDQSLPTGPAEFWNLLRHQVALMEQTSSGWFKCNLSDWRAWVFLYLFVCFGVRLAWPLDQTRHRIFAIVLVAAGAWVYDRIVGSAQYLENGWRLLSLMVGVLSLLLVVTLLAQAIARLVRIVIGKTA